jgi:4-hydroxy-3-methylbut-2-en-1-yl diphosphate reductase
LYCKVNAHVLGDEPMKVLRASALGMCFGVRDALQATAKVDRPGNVTIHGELVHNERILVQLQERGFRMSAEGERGGMPTTPTVLVTAHGISHRERGRLAAAGKRLIDTTCPLVRRVHEAALKLAAEDYDIVLIGRPGHVEVRGITEDLETCHVVASVDDVRTWLVPKLGVICQSTTPPRLAKEILSAIEEQNPFSHVRFLNTICQPTAERQAALEELCGLVDGVVVVGGKNSSNTRQLANLGRDLGVRVWQVQSAADLKPEWFDGCECVGLTAGTSTLDQTVDEIFDALCAIESRKRRATDNPDRASPSFEGFKQSLCFVDLKPVRPKDGL